MTADISARTGAGLRILVVGAGIGGLGVARALRQRGIATDIVERQPAWTHTGTGIYLPGNAARALGGLGLLDAVAERADVIPSQHICDHRGDLLADIDLAAVWGEVGPCLALHRADLHQILASHGEPVPVRMGLSVRQLHQYDGSVTAGFDDGTTASYDLVIGADGVHSTVRRLVLGVDTVRPVGQLAWRFVTECPPTLTTWTVMLGREITFLAVPIGDGRVYCYCDIPAKAFRPSQEDKPTQHLAELLSGFGAPVPAILDTLGPDGTVHTGVIEEVVIGSSASGCVLLVGDAAHATSPNMAEGAAMALEDGLVLAECLASEQTVARALAAFEARRIPRTRWVRAQTHRRDRTRSLPPGLRNFVLRRWGRKIFHANYRPLREVP